MTLRQSETMLRLMVGLALAFGFIGFATHGQAAHAAHLAGTTAAPVAALPH